jgi:predicted transcriptional regulator
MYVNEAMITDVKTCKAGSNLEEVARLMWDNDVGSIPVVSEDNRPLGIITDRDIAMCSMHRHQALWDIQAGQLIQSQRLCCCHQEDSIESCLNKMEQNEVRRVLVTNEDGTLAGIISMGDIVAFTREQGGDRKSAQPVSPGEALEMLRHVSGHHASPNRPPASM